MRSYHDWRSCIALLTACLIGGSVGAASAQTDERQRTQPIPRVFPTEFEPEGIRFGTMRFFPEARVAGVFDSNVFATVGGEIDDFLVLISPELELRSDWPAHELVISARGDIARYLDETDENYEDFRAAAHARRDLSKTTNIFAGVGFRRGHEDRGNADQVGAGKEPGIFEIASANIGTDVGVSPRVRIRLEGAFDRLDFDDVDLVGGGTVNHDDRDRWVYEGKARLGYSLAPGTKREIFVQGRFTKRDYRSSLDDLGVDRDSDGYEIVGGLALDLSAAGFITAEAYGGFLARNFDDAALETVDGPSFGATLVFAASPVTTLQASVARFIQESTLTIGTGVASGILQTVAGVSLDHLLARSLAFKAEGTFTNDDYKGISREDDIYLSPRTP